MGWEEGVESMHTLVGQDPPNYLSQIELGDPFLLRIGQDDQGANLVIVLASTAWRGMRKSGTYGLGSQGTDSRCPA